MIRARSLAWLLALALAAPCGGAHAHAVQVASEPADGAVLQRAPAEVVVRFNEPVAPTAVRLFDASGTRLPVEASPVGAGNAFRVALPSPLPDGRYMLSYRVTSADAHPVAGAVAFVVGRDSPGAPGANVPGLDGDDATARIAVRVGYDLAWMLALGAALFLLFVAPFPHSRRLLLVACAVVAVTACVGTGLHGVALHGGDAVLLAGEPWEAGLRSPRGTSALLSVLGAVLVGAGATSEPSRRRAWLVAGIAALTASALVSGHAATASPRGLAQAALALHVLGAAFWAGSLVALALLLMGSPRQAVLRGLQRFSGLALIAIPMFALAGVVLAVLELDSPDLWGTSYGRWILVKVCLLMTLLVVATANRWRWMPLVLAGDAVALGTLRRNVTIEIVLIAGAIGAAALLAQTPPARAEATGAFVHLVLVQRDVQLHFTLDPGRPGANSISLQFESSGGAPVDPAEVQVEFELIEAGVGPFVRTATRLGPGAYTWQGQDLALPGAWTVIVRARLGEFDQVVFRAEVRV